MQSPLRLSLVAELLTQGSRGLSVSEAVRRCGRHEQDIRACLAPMLRDGQVEQDHQQRIRLSASLSPEALALLQRVVEERSAFLARERRVRDQLFAGMIGQDPKMLLVFELVRQVARLDVTVLVSGETGSGKELVARAVHDLSRRSEGPFGAVNCAALTEELFASELFGHARGAFTGAVRTHVGWVERCAGGTLLLDEVGDLSLPNQVKLLRVLQEGRFTRVGESQERVASFRLLSCTNRDLARMVDEGSFREDLYYRLNVFPIRVPSLRERLDDLPDLVEGLLRQCAAELGHSVGQVSFTPAALARLRHHDWPGNVRELQNAVIRAAIAAGGADVEAHHLSFLAERTAAQPSPPLAAAAAPGLRSLAEVEQAHVLAVLAAHDGNKVAAAKTLGISRASLYARLARWGHHGTAG